MDDVLRVLEDERLIKRVYLRYCDVIDAKDYDALSEVFTRIDPDGDTASGHVHFYAVHQGARELTGKTYTCWGQYDDELVRTPEGWRVSRRMYTNYVEEDDKGIVNNNGGGGS